MTDWYKIKRILVWTQQVYPPIDPVPTGSIVYYKLKKDLKDYSWNWYDLKASWNNYTQSNGYTTLSWWTHFYNSNQLIVVNPSSSNPYSIVCCLRNFNTNYSNSGYQCQAWVITAYFSWNPQWWYKQHLCIANWYRSYSEPVWTIMKNVLSSTYNDSDTGTWLSITWNDWVHLVVTYNWSKIILYKNWVSVWEKSYPSFASSSYTWICIWYAPYWTSYWPDARYYRWDIKELAIFNRVLTSAEIQTYNWA